MLVHSNESQCIWIYRTFEHFSNPTHLKYFLTLFGISPFIWWLIFCHGNLSSWIVGYSCDPCIFQTHSSTNKFHTCHSRHRCRQPLWRLCHSIKRTLKPNGKQKKARMNNVRLKTIYSWLAGKSWRCCTKCSCRRPRWEMSGTSCSWGGRTWTWKRIYSAAEKNNWVSHFVFCWMLEKNIITFLNKNLHWRFKRINININ